MITSTVELPKELKGEDIEQACLKAAEELGYKTKLEDNFERKYKLGSIQEERVYESTEIRVDNMFEIIGIKRGKLQDRFYVWPLRNQEPALDERVKNYLSTVSKYI